MGLSISFFVETTPVAKGRPRFRSMGKFVQTYTPTKTRDYETLIAEQATIAMGGTEPLQTPLTVYLYFTLPIPQSTTKRAKNALLGTIHTKKPDIDNLIKAVLDGMDKIVFNSDGQIGNIHASKRYGTIGRVDILVQEAI